MFDSMTQWVVASGVALAILGTGFAAVAQEGGAKVGAQEGGAEVGAQEGGAEVGAQEGGAPKKDAAKVAAPEGGGAAASTKGTEAGVSKQCDAPEEGPARARADELVDCTLPGPGRVRVHLDAREEPFTFRPAERRAFIDDRWKHGGWQGTMCRGTEGAEVFICRGECDLFVLPGVYDISAHSYVGQAVIPAEGARVSRWGSPTVMTAGVIVMGVGYAVGIPLVLVAARESPEWITSDAGLIVLLSAGALAVGGSITALIAGPFVSVKPLAKSVASVSAPSAITLGAAPLPGGGIAFGGFRF
jgi:hypothetical protein